MSKGLNEKPFMPPPAVDAHGDIGQASLTPVMEALRTLWFDAARTYIPVAKKHHGVSTMLLSEAPTKDAVRFIKDRLEGLKA